MTEMGLSQWLEGWQPGFEEALRETLKKANAYDRPLWEAMEYSLMAGGKRVRPAFLTLTGLSLGADQDALLPFAMALEMIHTYSLIHDDLPAMDNDDYRRGRLTNHKVFGEATAILAGDGLLNLAAEVLSDQVGEATLSDPKQAMHSAKAMQKILHAAGPKGMIAGQIADMCAEKEEPDQAMLDYIDHNKTGQLLAASLTAGACVAGADERTVEVLEKAGFRIGTAFQIQDDILDVEGDPNLLGKKTGSDAQNQKATFVTLYGLKEAKRRAKELSEQAMEDLKILEGEYGAYVRELTYALIARNR